ncbi:trehalose operon repressor [Metabacillus arenae]|uniref:Trehalose operon repressor n=1 Tax=Metabacillus arenae TaxID=2771434 RepID=A0A926N8T9_9BACI|nr:trehalose operon repressor [Metabacillus arenae]MBD1379597.1 trehalose operon repressor [Metabacillus arenae]
MKVNKFKVIFQEIANQIKSGDLEPNKTLPSEHELAEQYGTSRETIRKALTLLAQNGFIQKIKGKGSVVLDMRKMSFPVSGLVSFKELAKNLGKASKTRVHEFGLIKADAFLKQQLNASSKDEIWKVVRSREIDGEKIILDKDFLMKKYIPLLTKEVCENSIYEYIEQDLGLKISFAKKEIVVEECTDEDRGYLDIDDFQHIVVVKNYVYLDDTSLFQYTESRHRLDKFRFVDFARRGH